MKLKKRLLITLFVFLVTIAGHSQVALATDLPMAKAQKTAKVKSAVKRKQAMKHNRAAKKFKSKRKQAMKRAKRLQTSDAVNINTADAKTLAQLSGIGAKRAKTIVEYREQYGKFKSVEDLAKVRGVGKSFIKRNQAKLKV